MLFHFVASRDERGITLLECLVAVAILSSMGLGIAASTRTLSTSSGAINVAARVDVTLTAFGEAVNNLAYVPCANAGDYQHGFEASQAALPPAQQISTSLGPSTILLRVTNVAACAGGASDTGTQTVSLAVCTVPVASAPTQANEAPDDCSKPGVQASRSTNIVKVDSGNRGVLAIVSGDHDHEYPVWSGPNETSATWDAVQKWQFSAVGSWAEKGIYAYEYTCDTSVATPPAVEYHANDVYECDYTASAPGTSPLSDGQGTYHVVTAELTVIDTSTPPITAKSKPVTIKVYDLRTAAVALDAGFVMSTSNTTVGDTMVFTPTSSDPAITSWVWNFGDTTYTGTNGEALCTGTYALCLSASHVYIAVGTGSFPVTLTVRNSLGQPTSSTQIVHVVQAAQPAPFPSFTLTPTSGVAPQTVRADATASLDSTGVAITDGNFTWAVFNGSGTPVNFSPPLGNHVTASFKPTDPGAYTVQLTVRGANGVTATISHSVTLTQLLPPTNVQVTNATAHLFGSSSVTISWTDALRSPNDQSDKYNIRISSTDSRCGFGLLDLNNSGGSLVPASTTAPYVQSYTWVIPGGFTNFFRSLFCQSSSYQVQLQTIRKDSDGVTWTSASMSSPVFFTFRVTL